MNANDSLEEDVGEDVGVDVPSFSSIGPSPSQRFYEEMAAEEEAIATALRDEEQAAAKKRLTENLCAENFGGDCALSKGEWHVREFVERDSGNSRRGSEERTSDFGNNGHEKGGGEVLLVQRGLEAGERSNPDPSKVDMMTEVRTITRVQDLPTDPRDAIGTILEEAEPARVPLVIEYLIADPRGHSAARVFAAALSKTPLELSIECQFLPKLPAFSNSDPHAELYSRPSSSSAWKLVGRTEKLRNSHFPRFVQTFRVNTNPMEESGLLQEFLVCVLARGTFGRLVRLGEAVATLKDIILAPGQCLVSRLQRSADPRKESWLVLSGAVCRDQAHAKAPRIVVVCVALAESARLRAKMNFIVARALSKGRWAPVYRSEDSGRPGSEYVPANLRFVDVFGESGSAMARVEFYQRRSGVDPKLTGFVQFGMRQVEKMEEGCAFQWMGGQGAVTPGNIMLVKKAVQAQEVKLWLSITNE